MGVRVARILAGCVAALLLTAAPSAAATSIEPNGPAAPFAVSPGTPNAQFTFPGHAGQKVAIDVELDPGFTISGHPTESLQDSSGHTVAEFFGTGTFGPYDIPTDGQYSVELNGDTSSGSGSVRVFEFTDTTNQVQVNAPPTGTELYPLQQATLTFSRAAGQTVGVDVRAQAPPGWQGLPAPNLFPAGRLVDPAGNELPLSTDYTLPSAG